MQSKAKTVAEYFASLPPDRKKPMMAVWKVMKKNLPKGYQTAMGYGAPGFVVPLSRYPQGYLHQKAVPLPYAGVASQKNYMSIYLMNVAGDPKVEYWFKAAWKKSGKKLDMGKSCIRFKKLEDLALDVVGEAVACTSVEKFIRWYEGSRKGKKK
jgi:hypothetical protein